MNVTYLEDVVRLPVDPMLIPGLVPYKGILLVGGAPGAGKTFYALECAMAIALGANAFGKFKGDVRKVLYVGEDAPGWDVGAMCRKLLRGHEMRAERADGSFAMLINQGANLNTTEGMLDLIGVIEREMVEHEEDEGEIETYPPSGLIILDSLRSMHDKSESSSDDMVAVMRRIKQLAQLACVMVLHHVAKPTEVAREGWAKIRGSGEIVAASDTIVNLTKRGGIVRVEVERTRAAKVMPFEYEMLDEDEIVRLIALEDSNAIRSGVVEYASSNGKVGRKDVLRIIEESGYKGSDAAKSRLAGRMMQRIVAEGVMRKIRMGEWKLCDNNKIA